MELTNQEIELLIIYLHFYKKPYKVENIGAKEDMQILTSILTSLPDIYMGTLRDLYTFILEDNKVSSEELTSVLFNLDKKRNTVDTFNFLYTKNIKAIVNPYYNNESLKKISSLQYTLSLGNIISRLERHQFAKACLYLKENPASTKEDLRQFLVDNEISYPGQGLKTNPSIHLEESIIQVLTIYNAFPYLFEGEDIRTTRKITEEQNKGNILSRIRKILKN